MTSKLGTHIVVMLPLFTRGTLPRTSSRFGAIDTESEPRSDLVKTRFCYTSSYVIFSYDLEGNVMVLVLVILTLCKHMF